MKLLKIDEYKNEQMSPDYNEVIDLYKEFLIDKKNDAYLDKLYLLSRVEAKAAMLAMQELAREKNAANKKLDAGDLKAVSDILANIQKSLSTHVSRGFYPTGLADNWVSSMQQLFSDLTTLVSRRMGAFDINHLPTNIQEKYNNLLKSFKTKMADLGGVYKLSADGTITKK
jgi:hypothetical protein